MGDTEKLKMNTGRYSWAVVVAQLLEPSVPTPEIRGSNPVIGNSVLY